MKRGAVLVLPKPATAGERPAVGEGEARPSPSPTLPSEAYDLGAARALALTMLLGLVFFAAVIAAVVYGVIR